MRSGSLRHVTWARAQRITSRTEPAFHAKLVPAACDTNVDGENLSPVGTAGDRRDSPNANHVIAIQRIALTAAAMSVRGYPHSDWTLTLVTGELRYPIELWSGSPEGSTNISRGAKMVPRRPNIKRQS